jgi:hypothetical protein
MSYRNHAFATSEASGCAPLSLHGWKRGRVHRSSPHRSRISSIALTCRRMRTRVQFGFPTLFSAGTFFKGTLNL